MQFSPDQEAAITGTIKCIEAGHKQVTLRGLAGTGKTTIVKELIRRSPTRDILIATPTGKAASVLNGKIDDTGYTAVTIHKMAYQFKSAKYDKKQDKDILVFDKGFFSGGLLFIDEASMVGKDQYEHLVSMGVPIVWVGDHGQLPPVQSQNPGVIDNPQHPCFTLTTVHRQAGDNPILDLAYHVREGGTLNDHFDGINYLPAGTPDKMVAAAKDLEIDQLIVATNKIRKNLNLAGRRRDGFTKSIGDGCPLLILRNNYQFDVYNGEVWDVDGEATRKSDGAMVALRAQYDPAVRRRRVHITSDREYQGREMVLADFGYALTCHKSQGSEWDHVGILNAGIFGDYPKWAYTAVTRAAKKLTIFEL